jgi:hypothetical protein
MHTTSDISGTTRLLILLLLMQTMLLGQGCSPLMSSRSPGSWKWWKKQDEPQVPNKITPMWTDTVMYQSGIAPLRGFGGRVMFFDGKSDAPIKVEGTLTVYAFDGTSADSSGTIPERKFVFPTEDLEKHYSESKLGPSYSFWLPWDEVGGYERRVTLITRFEPKSGGPTMSQPSRHYLPGLPAPDRPEMAAKSAPKGGSDGNSVHPVQAASFTDVQIDPTIHPRMSTITIDVPPSFVRHSRGDSLDHLREQLGQARPTSIQKESGRDRTVRRWWEQEPRARPGEQREGDDVRENSPAEGTDLEGKGDSSESQDVSRSTFPDRELGRRSLHSPRRDQIRRQPHNAQWIPSLNPTPRADWARNFPERWPAESP